jgi:hypothetical protein
VLVCLLVCLLGLVCLVLISDKDFLYVCVSCYGLSVFYLFVWFVSFVRLFDFVRVFVLVSRVWGVCLFGLGSVFRFLV